MKKTTRQLQIGSVLVGGDAPCAVQSMCSTDTRNIEATLGQIRGLAEGGCEIIRCAVPDMDAAVALGQVKRESLGLRINEPDALIRRPVQRRGCR